MAPMEDPTPTPGERRLSRPPSDRYRAASAEAEADPAAAPAQSPARGIAFAVVAAIGIAAAITVVGGVLLVSAGLIVLAAAGGWIVAIALKVGAGETLPRTRRIWLAGGIALGAVILGQVGLWLFARTEGGVLPIDEYLSQTFGPLVPLQALAATVTAAWSAR